MSAFVRIIVCLWVFGYGSYALHGIGALGLIVAGFVALWINHAWKTQQHTQELRAHRQTVIADEDLRAEIRQRRENP
jgi:hypothetical protein